MEEWLQRPYWQNWDMSYGYFECEDNCESDENVDNTRKIMNEEREGHGKLIGKLRKEIRQLEEQVKMLKFCCYVLCFNDVAACDNFLPMVIRNQVGM